MRIHRVTTAAVFFVMGALIAVPALVREQGAHDSGLPFVIVMILVGLASLVVIAPLVIIEIMENSKKGGVGARRSEGESLRRAAGLPPVQADIELVATGIEEKISHLEKSLKRLEKKEASAELTKQIAELRQGFDGIEEKLAGQKVAREWEDRRLSILVAVYDQAKGQLDSSYRISQVIASIGGLLLFSGIILALIRSDGNQTAAILAVIAGSITNLTSGVFLAQTNRARDHLGRQAEALREEVRTRDLVAQSNEIIDKVSEEVRRDELRAQVLLRVLAGSELAPSGIEETSSSTPGRSLVQRIWAGVNGRRGNRGIAS